MRAFTAALCLALPAFAAAVEDATQSLSSPLSAGSGATFTATKDKTALTAAIAWQVPSKVVHELRLGISGATGGTGDRALLFSSADGFAPGVAGKFGVAYSSARNVDVSSYTRTSTAFLNEAFCLDLAVKLAQALGVNLSPGARFSCVDAWPQVDDEQIPSSASTEAKAAIAKARDVLKSYMQVRSPMEPLSESTLKTTADVVKLEKARQAACDALKKDADALYACPAPEPSVEDVRALHRDVYARMFASESPLPDLYFDVIASYAPSLVKVDFAPIVAGAPVLSDVTRKNQFLQGATLDIPIYYREVAAGVQLGYTETLDLEPVKVCKTTTQGEFSSQSCKDAVLGEPDPKHSFTLTGTVAYVPTLRRGAASLIGGVQVLARAQWIEGGTQKYRLALPLYVTQNQTPIARLVAGIQPTLDWKGGEHGPPDLSVFLFVGARP